MNDDASTPVKSADRALTVLEHLASVGSPRSLSDIADDLGIPRSSLHGLLRNLQQRGWLTADEGDAGIRYRIGPQALTVGAAYLVNDDIVRRADPVLDRLSAELGETVHLGVLEGMEVMYLAKRDARYSLRLVSGVGKRLPAYATALGKLLLCELDADDLERRLRVDRHRLTANTLVSESKLRADLRRTARRGYAIDDEESTEGVRCLAVPLGSGSPHRYAISCSVPVARLRDGYEERVVTALLGAVESFDAPFDSVAPVR